MWCRRFDGVREERGDETDAAASSPCCFMSGWPWKLKSESCSRLEALGEGAQEIWGECFRVPIHTYHTTIPQTTDTT